jgi:hypothetical protein
MSDMYDSTIPTDVPAEDALEQVRLWGDGEEPETPPPPRSRVTLPREASEADALEQALPADADLDDDRR